LPSFFEADNRVRQVGAALGTSAIWTVVHQDLVRDARVRLIQRFLADIVEEQLGA